MPLYEYRCTSCGYSFEKIQSFKAEPEKVCPKCQGELIRPVTAPALRFEGAGWYVNDYAGKGGSKPAESSTTEAKTDSSSTEAKPAASAPAASAAASGTASSPASTSSANTPSSSSTPSA